MISIDERIPDVSLRIFGVGRLSERPTSEIFSGKRLLLIGIPGAPTPVCSGNHLPGYVEDFSGLLDMGIDEIMCISVNDAFVMRALGEAQKADGKAAMLAVSDGEFTRKVGLDVDASAFGLNVRSQRYAMVVNDGMVEVIEIEESFVDHGVSSTAKRDRKPVVQFFRKAIRQHRAHQKFPINTSGPNAEATESYNAEPEMDVEINRIRDLFNIAEQGSLIAQESPHFP